MREKSCQEQDSTKIEMLDYAELFRPSSVQKLFNLTKDTTQADGSKTRTKEAPSRAPKLNTKFQVPESEQNIRIWRFMLILGEGGELLCHCTNALAIRTLSRSSSDTYKSRWTDLTNGPRLFTFLAAYFAAAMMGIGSRHLEKVNPPQISQQGKDCFSLTYQWTCIAYGTQTLPLIVTEIR